MVSFHFKTCILRAKSESVGLSEFSRQFVGSSNAYLSLVLS